MKINEAKERNIALDGLRGCACLFVLSHHYFTGIATQPESGTFLSFIWKLLSIFLLSGVDLFYVLSGFLVGGIIIDHYRSQNFLKVFFIRRACRILPLYYLLIASYIVLPPILDHFKVLGDWSNDWLLEKPLPIWSYLTFSQSYIMGLENTSGPKWLAITWSVSVEEQFYLLMPLIFLIFGARKAAAIALGGILLAPLLRWYFFENIGHYAGYMFFPGRMDTILWGVILAFLVRSKHWRSLTNQNSAIGLGIALAAFSFIASSHFGFIRPHGSAKFTALAIFYFAIMWLIVENKIPRLNKILKSKFLVFTGLISYAAYMVHQLINGLVHGLIFGSKPALNSLDNFLATLLSICIVYFVCYLSYKYLESPILQFGKRAKYREAPPLLPTANR